MVQVEVPEDLARILKVRVGDLPGAVRRILAIDLYREKLISLGKAAEVAGVSKWEIYEILAARGVPIRYHPEDLEDDLETLRELKE